ncbi:hypothetical protein I0C86_40760 [Plantactinospora sp. S1510]|uniref:Uncharacterized protein n=1 Tax=Plantactinospora alkalitolerans TaxID=2789879 RepID=A0ABS0H9Q0_9ACTN|nr:hypothetical protein [Plantactinospora alkalitolerans]MBF9135213.1 hypothetical protein [Plantactinospora alkalitolerans]
MNGPLKEFRLLRNARIGPADLDDARRVLAAAIEVFEKGDGRPDDREADPVLTLYVDDPNELFIDRSCAIMLKTLADYGWERRIRLICRVCPQWSNPARHELLGYLPTHLRTSSVEFEIAVPGGAP